MRRPALALESCLPPREHFFHHSHGHYREVADDITHIELSFLLETTNYVFYSILMYFEHIFFRYPSVNQDETLIIQFLRASKLNMLKFQISNSFYYCVII